jgi:phosphate transport system substrate-binding protein
LKRLIPLAVMASLAVAACGSSKSSTSTTTTTPSSGSTASTATTASGGGATTVSTGNPSGPVTLTEAGSSLLYPFLQELVGPLKAKYPNITLAPAAGGSGKGISDAIAGGVLMGGSDAYLSSSQLAANPTLMNIPIVISSQAVNYNLPGISNLKLSGNVLAGMYQGKITKWNDPAITALNPGVTLPPTSVVPVRRVDSSGDTFLFTSFLTATNPTWANGPSMGTTVTWPAVAAEQTASGNPGMVQTCHATPGCVAYIGISAEKTALAAGLGQAELQNQAGAFVQPTAANVAAAVAAGSGKIPANLAAPLIYESGAQSYPIVNFEYLVVKSNQSSADTALAIRDFLTFAQDPAGGSATALLAKEQFQALPTAVMTATQPAMAKIQG